MNKLADSPAFPVSDSAVHALGLTKREYFAGIAMQAILPQYLYIRPEERGMVNPDAIKLAVNYTDALLAELAKTTSQSC